MRDLGGFARRVRHLSAAIELDHDHAFELATFHEVENGHEVHFAEPERAVAGHRRSAHPVLEVQVLHDGQECLDDRDRIDAALLELADIRAELHVPRVNSLHRRVRFIARLDGGAGVLMQGRNQADVRDGLPELVQRRDDVLLVVVVAVALATNTAGRPDDDRLAAVLLQDLPTETAAAIVPARCAGSVRLMLV